MAFKEGEIHDYFSRFTEDPDMLKYMAELVLASGMVKPSDLGFLCSGSSGVPKSVQLALDPHMQVQAVQLLDLACRSQIA